MAFPSIILLLALLSTSDTLPTTMDTPLTDYAADTLAFTLPALAFASAVIGAVCVCLCRALEAREEHVGYMIVQESIGLRERRPRHTYVHRV